MIIKSLNKNDDEKNFTFYGRCFDLFNQRDIGRS
jgi:hypothetical protein